MPKTAPKQMAKIDKKGAAAAPAAPKPKPANHAEGSATDPLILERVREILRKRGFKNYA